MKTNSAWVIFLLNILSQKILLTVFLYDFQRPGFVFFLWLYWCWKVQKKVQKVLIEGFKILKSFKRISLWKVWTRRSRHWGNCTSLHLLWRSGSNVYEGRRYRVMYIFNLPSVGEKILQLIKRIKSIYSLSSCSLHSQNFIFSGITRGLAIIPSIF